MRMLSIRGNDFIAHRAYEETISSHTELTPNEFSRMLSQRKNVKSFYMYSYAEHTRKWFKRWLSIRGNDFIADWAYAEMFESRISRPNRKRLSKISCYRPLGSLGFGFCKKVFAKISCLCTFKKKNISIAMHLKHRRHLPILGTHKGGNNPLNK